MGAHGVTLPLPHEGPVRSVHRGGHSRRLLVLLGLLALVVFAVRALDPNRPWMKRQVQSFVLSRSGLEIDYRAIHVHPLSGIDVDGFVVRTPPEFRAVAPELLRAELLDVRWSPSSLFGDGPRIQRIALSGVGLAVVVDEHGRSSLDAVLSRDAAPLSHRAGELLASTPVADRIDAARGDLAIIQTQAGRVVEHDAIRGLELGVTTQHTAKGWLLSVAAGSTAGGPGAVWTRERDDGPPAREARAALSLAGVVTASKLEASMDLSLREQSLAAGLDLGGWHAEVSALFEPDAGRTNVALEAVAVPEGTALAAAALELPDVGAPVLRHARGDLELARLLAWLPTGLVPVDAEHGLLHVEVQSAVLDDWVPRLTAEGFVRMDADLYGMRARTPVGAIEAGRSRTSIEARPSTERGVAVRGSQQLDDARVDLGQTRVDVRDLSMDFEGERAQDGALTGSIDSHFDRVRQRTGSVVATVRDGRCQVHLDGLHAGGSDLRAREMDASAAGLLQVFDAGASIVGGARAHARVELRDVLADARRPLASRGGVRAWIDADGARVSLDAVSRADALDYTLNALAPRLAAIRPFLSPALAGAVDWAGMGVELRSKGRVEGIAGPRPWIRHDTSVEMDRPAFGGTTARSLSLALHSEGTASRHRADASLRVSALTIEGTPPSDDSLAVSASWDREARSVHLDARAGGRADARIDFSASFDGDARAVTYDANGRFAGLARLAPLVARVHQLDGLDLSRLELLVGARGALLGVVSGIRPDGAIELEPDPWHTAAIEGAADVRVSNAHWTRRDVALEVPVAVWHAEMHSAGESRVLAMHADIASVRLGLGRHEIDVAGISDDTTATVSGDLVNPAVDLTQRATARVVDQDLVAGYPAAAATIEASLQREPEGLVRISDMHVRGGAGTTLDVRGGIDLGGRGGRKLSVVAHMIQELQPLSFVPGRFSGRGQVRVAATVESPDLSFFRTRLQVTASGVDLRIPSAGLDARSVDADVPVHLDFDAIAGGVRVRRDGHNPYAMLRFADQQPFLKRSGFLSIGHLTMPQLEISRFVGNLAVEQNVVSLGQFEMGVRGGQLAGDGALDLEGPDSRLVAHLRATGVRSTYGEPLDGNMAVVLSASDRSIEGRAEILRMGKRHLLDVLEVEDPLRVDPAMNRIRGALAFGYPSRVHVAFGNGFARARVELGGLARFMSIDELRGIPTGPLVDRFVRAVLDGRMAP